MKAARSLSINIPKDKKDVDKNPDFKTPQNVEERDQAFLLRQETTLSVMQQVYDDDTVDGDAESVM